MSSSPPVRSNWLFAILLMAALIFVVLSRAGLGGVFSHRARGLRMGAVVGRRRFTPGDCQRALAAYAPHRPGASAIGC
ncbi:MAG: hypothetical protein IPM07_16455 [Anaerolineales bacterium]|nr:hypothetical protein [Anaerolineales bacterium]